jgi:hypothetical protein
VSDLQAVLEQVRRKITRYGKTRINEQNTKATLIQPILRSVVQDVGDSDHITSIACRWPAETQ